MARHSGENQHLTNAQRAIESLNKQLQNTESTSPELVDMTSSIRHLQRLLSGTLALVAMKASQHAAGGIGLPPQIVLGDKSTISEAEVQADIRRARVAATFPLVGEAITAGTALAENVDILARTTERMTTEEIDQLKHKDRQLASTVPTLTGNSFRKKVQRYRDNIRKDNGQTAAQQATAETTATITPTRNHGNYRVHAILDVLQGEAAQTALHEERRALGKTLGTDHGMDSEQLAAQALYQLIMRGSTTTATDTNNRAATTMHVLTDHRTLTHGPHVETIAETLNGMPLTPGTVGRLACDCTIQRIDTLPDGNVNVSRTSRTATPTQRAALRSIYSGCAISGAPWSHVEIHHIKFVSRGGKTVLDNLIPLSSRWHHLIHDASWSIEVDTDRTLRLYQPNGTLHKTIPSPTPVLYQQAA